MMTTLTWTTEKPTVPGWYWLHETSSDRRYVVEVRSHGGVLSILFTGGEFGFSPEKVIGEWFGPLEVPK